MKDIIEKTIREIKGNPAIRTFDEAATKQAIVLRILHLLKWDTFNIGEVQPEYTVSGRKVDYCLHYGRRERLFIEVKRVGEELDRHQEQLLDYAFKEGVELAILTNGVTWWFYLPIKKGSWEQRKFYAIDFNSQDPEDVSERFFDFLSKDSVASGHASDKAEELLKSKDKERILNETMPKAWGKMISLPDETLIDLIAETTEEICGYKPDKKQVIDFIVKNIGRVPPKSPPQEPSGNLRKKKPKTRETPPNGIEKITQQELVPYIIECLKELGGRAKKQEVEKCIYNKLQQIFEQDYYRQTVSHGIPRWKQNIAFAKEIAKNEVLIKRPSEAEWGVWELTEKGFRY